MPTAYVLLTTEIGAEKHVLKALRKIDEVQEAHALWGIYDIIANVKAESTEALKKVISKYINNIGKVNSKFTMIIENESPSN